MKVKLVRKFANVINGVDISEVRVGEVFELSAHHAALLVGEGWAELVEPHPQRKTPQTQVESVE